LVAYVVAWTVYGTIALGIGGIHSDMSEAYSWGQELQLGYFKHPPFWAWLTFAWFEIFPRENWSFYLLSSLNAAAGLWGVWALAGLFLRRSQRLAVVLLLMLSPCYGFMALKLNANTILLSLWPWTTYFFVRSLKTRNLADGVLLGLFAGLGMLSKYYTLVLLAAFVAAALLAEERRQYFRSPAPYVAAAICALMFLPHVVWVLEHGGALDYAQSRFSFTTLETLRGAINTSGAPLIYFGSSAAVLLIALRLKPSDALRKLAAWAALSKNAWILPLAFMPFLLTLFFGFVGQAKVSQAYTIPIFYMLPIVALMAFGDALSERAERVIALCAAVVLVVASLGSPAIAYARFAFQAETAVQPRIEVANVATDLWRTEMPGKLKIVAGTQFYAQTITFYAPDSPSHLIEFNYAYSPWITPERVKREGMLIVCTLEDLECRRHAEQLMTPASKQVEWRFAKELYGLSAPEYEFVFTLIPGQE
jgi:4-amino-4-deoxy-L-arabinose transferase-like glycosyltransferase